LFFTAQAKETRIFEAEYDIFWRGWRCGQMVSQLVAVDEQVFHYKQHLISNLFFYPFEQIEQSFFSIKDHQIISESYDLVRHGLDGPSYHMDFQDDKVILRLEDAQQQSFSINQSQHYCDRLVTQLVLLRAFSKNKDLSTVVVRYVDQQGFQERTYSFSQVEDNYEMISEHHHKASSFILSNQYDYFPEFFKQYRRGKMVFEGRMTSLNKSECWQDFLSE
jgi:hypothetical protein